MKSLTKLLMMVVLTAGSALSQTSAVTATITDPDSQTWNNGTYTINFIPAPNSPGPSTWTGGALTTQFTGSLNSSGVLSVSVADNTTVSPPGSLWQFTLCPNSSAPCQNVRTQVTGASPNLSTTLSNGLIAPRFGPGPFAYGYQDVEVVTPLLPGVTYWDVSTTLQRIWNGSAWVNNTSSGGTGTVSSCGTAGALAQYLAPGTTVNCDTTLTDLVGVLLYTGTSVNAPEFITTGTTGGQVTLGQGTAPGATPANAFSLRAPTSIVTGYFWAVPGADCNGLVTVTTDAITCTATSGLANVVYTNTANTFTAAGTLDISASTVANALKIPSAAGLTSNGTSSIGYDTTAGNFHIPIAGADAITAGFAAAGSTNRIPKLVDSTHGLLANSALTDSGTKLTYNGSGGFESDNNPIPAYALDTGAAQAIAITVNGFPAAIQNGLCVVFKTANASGGATTLNVTPSGGSAYGAIALDKKTTSGVAVLAATGDVTSGGIYTACYDGTQWVLGSPSGTVYTAGSLTAAGVLSGNSNNQLQGTSAFLFTSATGLITKYNNIAVTGVGIPSIQASPAVVTIGSGTSIGSTSLCTAALCPAGLYRVNVYVDITTPCGTTGTYLVNLIYTDDQGSKTVPVNINGTGAVPATGLLTTTSTANFGENAQVVATTGATTINYSTTAVACGTAGPMVGKMYLSVDRIQ